MVQLSATDGNEIMFHCNLIRDNVYFVNNDNNFCYMFVCLFVGFSKLKKNASTTKFFKYLV